MLRRGRPVLRAGAALRAPVRRISVSNVARSAYGFLKKDAPKPGGKEKFDLVIVGGGSGGLAMSKEASVLGKKVALLDYVQPSPAGTKWGLGGTCVNVGCIPKKLMHQSALLGHAMQDAPFFGWTHANDNRAFDWATLSGNVQQYIKSLNWGYRKRLASDGVRYLNARGAFADSNTIEAVDDKGVKTLLESEHIAIAVGGRPRALDIPGAEHVISSDDLFWRAKPPGKTLIIGASYVALECAGFLSGIGCDTTVMARSIFLRGFDQDMANLAVQYMRNHDTKFLDQCVPVRVDKLDSGRLRVTYAKAGGETAAEEFDTVFAAIGRDPAIGSLRLDRAAPGGLQLHAQSRKLLVDAGERSLSAKHIFAFGDVAHGRPELTPSAIAAGRLLARRLYSREPDAEKKYTMDYRLVPTTVFTPLEYSCVGSTEEDARAQLGDACIEVVHAFFQPLEWTLPGREDNACYAKLVVDARRSDPRDQPVLGVHYLGPNAGEVMQGFAVALRRGATRHDFEHTVGIHPTTAEEMVRADITKRSGKDPKRTGC